MFDKSCEDAEAEPVSTKHNTTDCPIIFRIGLILSRYFAITNLKSWASTTGLTMYGIFEDLTNYGWYPAQTNSVWDLDYLRWTNEGAFVFAEAPDVCGDPGTQYSEMDLNLDCYVNFGDFVLFASEWLDCTDPTDEACDTGE